MVLVGQGVHAREVVDALVRLQLLHSFRNACSVEPHDVEVVLGDVVDLVDFLLGDAEAEILADLPQDGVLGAGEVHDDLHASFLAFCAVGALGAAVRRAL